MKTCAISGRKGINLGPDDDDIDVSNESALMTSSELQPGDMANDGAPKPDDFTMSNVPHVANDLDVESIHTATPEVSYPSETQSNGLFFLSECIDATS